MPALQLPFFCRQTSNHYTFPSQQPSAVRIAISQLTVLNQNRTYVQVLFFADAGLTKNQPTLAPPKNLCQTQKVPSAMKHGIRS